MLIKGNKIVKICGKMTGVLCCKDWKNILRLRYQRYVKQFGYIV